VNTQDVRLSSSGAPTIAPAAASPHGAPSISASSADGVNFHDFIWTLLYQIAQDPHDAVASVNLNPSVQMTCAATNRKVPVATSTTFVAGSSIATLTLTLTYSANDSTEKLDTVSSDSSKDACVLTGSVDLTLGTGDVVPRSLPNTTVYYPKPAGTAALAIAVTTH
jgi:hypothetical protein